MALINYGIGQAPVLADTWQLWIFVFVLFLLYKVLDIWLSVRVMLAHLQFFSEFPYHCGLVTAVEIGVAVAALPMTASLLSSNWTKTRVFIAYNRTRLENAELIRSALARCGIDAYLNPPRADLSHDHLLNRFLRQLNISNMVIALPGATQSFVDAEIFSASRSRLPMVVIAWTDEDSLPNTMFSGYPTFEFEKLSSNDFVPLGRFCLFAVNHWRFTLASLWEGVKAIGVVWSTPMARGLSVLTALLSYFAMRLAYAAEMLIGGMVLALGAIRAGSASASVRGLALVPRFV